MIGKNLSIDNSFTLKFANATSTPFTFNLFNQGGGGAQQTAITTGQLSIPTNSNQSIPFFVNGVVIDPFGMEVVLNTISNGLSFVFPLGTTIAQINTFYQNNVINGAGQVGSFVLIQKPNTTDQYDMRITIDIGANIVAFIDLNIPPLAILFPFNTEQVSFVTNNPFITIGGVVSITTIQNSETGNSYRIMGVDIISDNPNQLLEDINYGNKTADGNRWLASFTPTIDPYQENAKSLHAIGSASPIGAPMDEFTISTDTTFSYTILGNTFSRLTFNYVRASEANMNLFNQAIASELLMKFAQEKKYLDSLKYRKGVFLQ